MRYKKFTISLFFVACVLFALSVFAAKALYQPLRFQIEGVEDPAILKNIKDSLLNLRSSIQLPMTDAKAHKFYKNAPTYIQNAIKPYGYFRGTIHATFTKTSHGWFTEFVISLGPPLLITSVNVEIHGAGAHDRKFVAWLTRLPLKTGETLNTIKYNNVKTELYNLATERGYFDAKMQKSQITINLQTYQSNIEIIFDTGKRYRFGETTFSHSTFSDSFLRRFLRYEHGHYFNAKKLVRTQAGMVSSSYFNQVIINPSPKHAVNDEVPIYIHMIPRKGKEYTVGLGYGSDTKGFRGTLGMAQRHIGHEGHRFSALIRGSQTNSSLTAKYMIPGPDPSRDLFSIGAGASNISQSNGSAKNIKFGSAYTFSRGHWKNTFTLSYLNERYNFTGYPFTSTQLLYPTAEFKYTNADHLHHPSRGISWETQMAGADKNILSRTDFFQIVMHLKTLFTIQKTKTRFIFRSDLGHTSIPNLIRLPFSLQLLTGGSKSVRGYGYNTIGPGRNLVVASQEIQQRVYGNFYVAGFIDAGVVGNDDVFHHINVGSGPAVAWITPVGTIEISYAKAFTQKNKPWTIHFTMGTDL